MEGINTPETSADPKELGFDPDRLKSMKRSIQADIEKGLYDGAVFIVARHGQIALHEATGKTDLEKTRNRKPMTSSSSSP